MHVCIKYTQKLISECFQMRQILKQNVKEKLEGKTNTDH